MDPDGMVALLNYRVSFVKCPMDHRIWDNFAYLFIIRRMALRVSLPQQPDSHTDKHALAYLTFWKDGLKVDKY